VTGGVVGGVSWVGEGAGVEPVPAIGVLGDGATVVLVDPVELVLVDPVVAVPVVVAAWPGRARLT
jgi:hypothetical protein